MVIPAENIANSGVKRGTRRACPPGENTLAHHGQRLVGRRQSDLIQDIRPERQTTPHCPIIGQWAGYDTARIDHLW